MRRYVLILLLALAAHSYADNVVVWDFATRDGEKNKTTESLTYEFEEALLQNCSCTVLERRKLDRLQAVIENEKALQDIDQLTATGSTELRKLGATVVVFGEVFDDVESGDVTITVTFQDFQGKKTLIKSVLLRRGLLRDATSRREKLTSLVQAISGVGAKRGRVQENDFIFDLQSCTIADRTVVCRFQITNNGEDRKLSIILGEDGRGWIGNFNYRGRTLIYDDFNNEAQPARVQLANSNADASRFYIDAMLISGRPADASIRFDNLSSKATTITRLDLTCVDGETNNMFVATFRNVGLTR